MAERGLGAQRAASSRWLRRPKPRLAAGSTGLLRCA